MGFVGFFDPGCPKSYFQSLWTSVSRKLLQYHNTTDLASPILKRKETVGKTERGGRSKNDNLAHNARVLKREMPLSHFHNMSPRV